MFKNLFSKENPVDINEQKDENYRKLSYDEISYIYDSVIRTALDTLFAQANKHGWTEKEFNDATTALIMAEQQKLITRWVH
jgi:hypothetical protein